MPEVNIMGLLEEYQTRNPNESITRTVNVSWVLQIVNTVKTALSAVVSKTANGLAPQLPNETATTKYLRQDGTWQVPPDTNTTYSTVSKTAAGLAPQLPNEATTTKYLRQDGTWQVPPDTDTNTTYSEMSGTTLGLVKLNGNYTFTGVLNVPTPALPS
jgi:hypothetical protein